MKGVIYILQNSAYVEDMLKIGMTTRTAEERAREIFTNSTGVPAPFTVAYSVHTYHCGLAEKLIHKRLDNYKVSDNREWFKISIDEAKKIVDEIIKAVNGLHNTYTTPLQSSAKPQKQDELNADRVRYFSKMGEFFSFYCTHCSEKLRASLERFYVEIKCPHCSQVNKLKYKKKRNDECHLASTSSQATKMKPVYDVDSNKRHPHSANLDESYQDLADYFERRSRKIKPRL